MALFSDFIDIENDPDCLPFDPEQEPYTTYVETLGYDLLDQTYPQIAWAKYYLDTGVPPSTFTWLRKDEK